MTKSDFPLVKTLSKKDPKTKSRNLSRQQKTSLENRGVLREQSNSNVNVYEDRPASVELAMHSNH